MPGTVFYDGIVATLFSDLCDTFTISLSVVMACIDIKPTLIDPMHSIQK